MWVDLVKKEIKSSDIIIRLLLLFMWPYGIIPLIVSKRIKHKVCLAFIYFALCCLIGLPLLMFILLLLSGGLSGNGIVLASDWVIQWWSETLLYGIVILAIALPIYIRKLKQDKFFVNIEVAEEDIQKKVDEFRRYQQEKQDEIAYQKAMRLTEEEKERLKKYRNHNSPNDNDYLSNDNHYNENNTYQKAQVLTEREKNFYETIRLIAEKHNLNVSAKMRLADIVNVSDYIEYKSSKWYSEFNRINKKHIDFALADKNNLDIKLLIEIDDSTHQREDRIERDKFVDSVCEQVNIPILHLYDVIGLEDKIINILHSEKTEQEM